MGTVLNAPVSADGTGKELGVVTGLAGVVADLLTCRPQAGAGVLRICQARDPGDTGDQRLPGRVQLASGVEDLNAAMLLAAMPAAVPGPFGSNYEVPSASSVSRLRALA